MRAGQWKTTVVLLHLLYGNLPSPNRVALLAVGSQLAAMNICMTVLAVLADIAEYGLDVTFRTRDGFMHAAERILGFIVIEFRNGADRFPGVSGMAVLAGDVEIAVRTMRAPRSLRPAKNGYSGKRQK